MSVDPGLKPSCVPTLQSVGMSNDAILLLENNVWLSETHFQLTISRVVRIIHYLFLHRLNEWKPRFH